MVLCQLISLHVELARLYSPQTSQGSQCRVVGLLHQVLGAEERVGAGAVDEG